MAFTLFPTIGEAGMADGQNPKDGGDYDPDNGKDAKNGKSIEDDIEEKPTPLLAGEKIHGWEEYKSQVDHVNPFGVRFGWVVDGFNCYESVAIKSGNVPIVKPDASLHG